MRKNVRKTALLTAAVFACFAGQPACAQEPEAYQLDTVVVTATRSERAPLDTPANVTIITAKEIRDKGYQSAFEAVQELSQANVHTYQQDGGDYGSMMSRIRLRGIDDATLVLINGNPANYMNHASLNNIPVDQIAKIEIVKGANSVLYGPQAMGGVINIITKRPEKTGEVHGTVSGSYGTRRNTGSLSVTTDSVNAGYRKQVYRDFHNVATPGSQGNSTTAIDIVGKRGEQYYVDAAVGKDLTFSYGRTENQSSYKTGRWRNYVPTLNRLTQYRSTFDNYSLAYDNKENGWKAYVGYNSIRADVLPSRSRPVPPTPIRRATAPTPTCRNVSAWPATTRSSSGPTTTGKTWNSGARRPATKIRGTPIPCTSPTISIPRTSSSSSSACGNSTPTPRNTRTAISRSCPRCRACTKRRRIRPITLT